MNNPPHVLIVEDASQLAVIFEEILTTSGCAVSIAIDGAVVMSRLEVEAPDLMLLDMHLPQVSGLEILQYVRSAPHLTNTRVIAMTGNPLLTATITDSADLVLIKPFSLSQLTELVQRLLPRTKTS